MSRRKKLLNTIPSTLVGPVSSRWTVQPYGPSEHFQQNTSEKGLQLQIVMPTLHTANSYLLITGRRTRGSKSTKHLSPCAMSLQTRKPFLENARQVSCWIAHMCCRIREDIASCQVLSVETFTKQVDTICNSD